MAKLARNLFAHLHGRRVPSLLHFVGLLITTSKIGFSRIRLFGLLIVNLLALLNVSRAASVTWTNTTASASFTNASNWNPVGVPGGNDTATFTNSTTYTVAGFTNFLNSSAVVGALSAGTAGTVTFAIGSGNTWTLTNSFRIATNSANTAAAGMNVILTTGTLAVTNSAGTGLLNIGEVGTGTFILNGGTLITDTLLAPNLNGATLKSTLTLTKGTLTTLNGSSISNNANFNLGGSGSGDTAIWNMLGGTNRISLTSGKSVVIGFDASSSGNKVTVAGVSTVWTNNCDIFIGVNSSSSSLVLSNGAKVFCAGITVGSVSSFAQLTISNGGTLFSSSGTIGSYGNSSSALATALVMGAGSVWTNSGDLFIGSTGGAKDSALKIAAGGTVFNVNATVGAGGNSGAGSGNSATVTDAGSSWINLGTLTIGSLQGGPSCVVLVSNGAGLVTSYALVGGGGGANDSVTVTGGGSAWTNLNTLSVGAGGGNFNGVIVSTGGKVFSADSVIGISGSSNTGLVTGAGSEWNNSGTFVVGALTDNNTLTVTNSGLVTAANVFIGTNSASTGNKIIVANGSLFATNSSNTGKLVVGLRGQGSFFFNGGTVTVDQLIVTNTTGNINRFILNAGTLSTRNSTVTNGFAFVVGDGVNAAVLNLVGGTHLFYDGLTNSAGATITGGGVVQSRFQVANLGSIIATNTGAELRFTNETTVGNSTTLGASAGATLTFGTAGTGSALVTNFGTIILSNGTFRSGNLTNLANGVITGFGTNTSALLNLAGGTVVATNGTLGLTGSSVTNGGFFRVSNASTLNVAADWISTGTITNLGGAITGGALTNLGLLVGFGTNFSALVNSAGATVLATNGELLVQGAATGAGTYRAAQGANAATLTFAGGSISALFNTGATVRVQGPLTNSTIFANAGTLVLAGGTYRSTANLTNATGFQVENLAGNTGTLDAPLVNAGTLAANSGTLVLLIAPVQGGAVNIAASGNLDVRSDWTNTGTINIATGGALVGNTLTNLASATGSISGSGFIKNFVVNQGRMDFGGTISNNFIQTAGSFTLSGNATVTGNTVISGGALDLTGNWLTNGLLVVSSTGMLTNNVAGGTVSGGITNAATIAVTANTFFNGVVTNTGNLFFQGAISNNLVSAGTVFLNNNATITGTASLTAGTFDLNGKILSNNLMVVSSAAVLTNSQAGATLRGALSLQGGTISGSTINNTGSIGGTGTIAGSLANAGTLVADSGTLTFTVAPTQNGAVLVGAGGNLNVTPTWANNGTIALNASGAITGGTLTNVTTSTSGITGGGFIKGMLVNQGSLNWAGTISNNFVQTAGGSFTLNGNATITGNATIAGGAVDLQGNRLSSGLLVVSGAGIFTNAVAGGTVNGSISNAATIAVTANTFFNGAVTNTGVFVFRGAVSNSVANSGSLIARGDGTVTGQLGNSGSLNVTGGTLRLLTAPVQSGTITIASDGTLSVTPAWANSGTLLVMGGTVEGGNLTNTASGTIRNAGTITSVLINFGDLQAIGGSGLNIGGASNVVGSTILVSNSSINASGLLRNAGNVVLFNSSGTLQAGALNTGSIIVSNSPGAPTTRLDVSGSFVNDSTLNFIHSVATFHSFVANSGTWITDPTTNIYESAFTNDTAGVISMAVGDVYIFRTNSTGGATVGSFVDISTNNVANDKLGGKFLFENTTLALTQNFYAAGHDLNQADATTPTNQITVTSLSPLPAGYSTNFSLGTLEIANFTTVRVWDAFGSYVGSPGTNDTLRAALYVTNLLMGANSYLIISSNVSVYFLTSNTWSAANFTLLGGPVLANQGQLHQFVVSTLNVVPEPSVLLLWVSGIATVWAARRRSARKAR